MARLPRRTMIEAMLTRTAQRVVGCLLCGRILWPWQALRHGQHRSCDEAWTAEDDPGLAVPWWRRAAATRLYLAAELFRGCPDCRRPVWPWQQRCGSAHRGCAHAAILRAHARNLAIIPGFPLAVWECAFCGEVPA